MNKLTDNDKTFGPITYGKTSWNPWRIIISSGGDEECPDVHNNITFYIGYVCISLKLLNLIQPYRRKVKATNWDEETITRLGRDWYFITYPREYGFSISQGFLQLFFGQQTHDSDTEKTWSTFLPWTQWQYIGIDYYDDKGELFCSEKATDHITHIEHCCNKKEDVPKVVFEIEDFDGEHIFATTHIEKRTWLRGTSWCSWLSLFSKPKVIRSLAILYSSETGPKKGTWKGGTIGHSIDMLEGELHKNAFIRYCDNTELGSSNKRKITFIK